MNALGAFIEAEKTTHSIAFLCRVLNVARSSFYAWRAAQPAAAQRRFTDHALAHRMHTIHVSSRGAYGVPPIHAALRRTGEVINHKRVERIMSEHGIHGITRRKHRGLTRPDKTSPPAADLVRRDFQCAEPGTKLVGDITFLPTLQGWWYLATVIDLTTREVIGYAMADHHRSELVADSLKMAAGRGNLKPGCIMHTDRGSEYTSTQFRSLVADLGFRQSMGRTGSCYDNAVAESFFGFLKAEIGSTTWESHEQARSDVFHFIEIEYNRTRLRRHPDFGYLTPIEARHRRCRCAHEWHEPELTRAAFDAMAGEGGQNYPSLDAVARDTGYDGTLASTYLPDDLNAGTCG